MGVGIAAWWVVRSAMTLDGYPGLERFYLPAAALTCVLAGVGVVQLAQLAGNAVAGARTAVTVAAATILVLISIPFTTSRVNEARAAFPAACAAPGSISLARSGRRRRGPTPCSRASSFAAVNHSVQTALAWKLHVTLERVGTVMSAPGVTIGPTTRPTAVRRRSIRG